MFRPINKILLQLAIVFAASVQPLFGLGLSISGLSSGILDFQNSTSIQTEESPKSFLDNDYIYDQWTVKEGLPVNSTTKIITDNKGYLWFGSTDGLVRFDGVEFKIFKSSEYPSLPTNRIMSLKTSRDGTLWLVTDQDEIIGYKDSKFRQIKSEDGLFGDEVNYLYTDSEQRLWMGTERGITRYHKGQFVAFEPEKIQGPISRVYVNKKGEVWYKNQAEQTLYQFDGEKVSKVITVRTENGMNVNPILTLEDGSTLIGANRTIWRYKEGKLHDLGFPSAQITDIYQSENGIVRVATKTNGVFRKMKDKWIKKHQGSGWSLGGEMLISYKGSPWFLGPDAVYKNGRLIFQSASQISDYVFDREGSLWLTTSNAGLLRLKPRLFQFYKPQGDKKKANIYSVQQTDNGSIWFGTYGSGPVRLKDGGTYSDFDFKMLAGREVPNSIYVQSIIERKNGELLIGVLGEGLFRFEKEEQQFRQLSTPFPLESKEEVFSVYTLYEDRNNILWAGTNYGLFQQKKGKWQKVKSNSPGLNYPVRYITEAPDGSLWLATNGRGILHYQDHTFTTYDTNDDLSSNLIRSLYIDTADTTDNYLLYVGSEDKGLNRIEVNGGTPNMKELVVIDKGNGLYSNGIHQILADSQDRLWMSSNQGLFYVSKSQLDRLSSGELGQVTVTGYNEESGLKSREFNGGVQEAGIKDNNGNLWFPSQEALVKVNPTKFPHNTLPPPLVIEEVISEEQKIAVNKDIVSLDAKQRNFEIEFTGLSFWQPDAVQFKYRLKGFDTKWINAGTRRTAFYTNVPAGEYTFEVTAANNEGIWNPKKAQLTLNVRPYFYETTIFYVLVSILGIVLLGGLVKLRTYRLKRREKELEEAVQERSHQLMQEKIKTEKQAQELMRLNKRKNQFFTNITHELRTPLTMLIGPLKILRENEDIEMQAVRDQLEPMIRNGKRLQRLIDQLLELSRIEAGMVELQASRQSMTSFVEELILEFSPMAEVKNICLTTELPDSDCMIYFDNQKIQKALSNLLSNALKFTSENGRVSVKVIESNTEVTIKVSDTGIGIDEEEVSHIFDRFYQVDSTSTRKNEGTGVGLAFAKELVHLHKGTLTVESTLGEGSTFSLSLLKGKTHLTVEQITEPGEETSDNKIESSAVLDARQKVENYESDGDAERDTTTLLVIDDNADIRDYIRTIMAADYTILEASDGKEGLSAVRKQLPDLVICDVMMPEMDGFELSSRLKEDTMTRGIPLIFVTAMADKQGQLKGLQTGADSYITKPFDADVLRARVKNLLEQRKRLHEVFTDSEFDLESVDQSSQLEQQVSEVIEEHLTDSDFTVSQLADEVAIDRSHLSRKLKEEVGVTPAQLIRDIRLKKATHLLREDQYNISEIAYSVGFNSLSYFSRRFKEKYGVSPSAYLDDTSS
ncbi:hybrid sensor histidine kinase/response regulator transcription factor [Fodinibius halophilus]|uniref:histidine kinase n=1 Tax=Fodinibius halophilus TaxID=1736908 RepID=A0A6M1TB63_9BACT|nr:ATP-binding protein [Fodinibius halophilus]NGP89653.1 response regulator [Fodinibius halophilus]